MSLQHVADQDERPSPPKESAAHCLEPTGLQVTPNAVFGADVDLVDYLCPTQDVRLSSAALLSARFPLISPSARVVQCDPKRVATTSRTYVVDGGYHEGSGSVTAFDVWLGIAPLIEAYNANPRAPAYLVPFMIQLDNGYNEPAGPGAVPAPQQLFVPASAYGASWGANQERARQAAQIAFQREFDLTSSQGRLLAITQFNTTDAGRPKVQQVQGWFSTHLVDITSKGTG